MRPMEPGRSISSADETVLQRCAALALGCVDREFPNHVVHLMNGPEDAGTPRQLTPIFYGCFDWHSAVHAHWSLARSARACPAAAWAERCRAVLAERLTEDRAAGELWYLTAPGREGFERPYGLAWLLQLAAECREWANSEDAKHAENPKAGRWAEIQKIPKILAPLEELAAARFLTWLPKLSAPIRSGEHSQTAFALGLVDDWAGIAGRDDVRSVVREFTERHYTADRAAPWRYEPSGHDFLSPVLAEADLMRRVRLPAEFAGWLTDFLPELDESVPFEPVAVSDAADGKLAHFAGLNLSRAWMLAGIAAGLPPTDPRVEPLQAVAARHRAAGLATLSGPDEAHYAVSHWVGTFAVYLITQRGG